MRQRSSRPGAIAVAGRQVEALVLLAGPVERLAPLAPARELGARPPAAPEHGVVEHHVADAHAAPARVDEPRVHAHDVPVDLRRRHLDVRELDLVAAHGIRPVAQRVRLHGGVGGRGGAAAKSVAASADPTRRSISAQRIRSRAPCRGGMIRGVTAALEALVASGRAALQAGDAAGARRSFEDALEWEQSGTVMEGLARACYLELDHAAAIDQLGARLCAPSRRRRPPGRGAGRAHARVHVRHGSRRAGGHARVAGARAPDAGGQAQRAGERLGVARRRSLLRGRSRPPGGALRVRHRGRPGVRRRGPRVRRPRLPRDRASCAPIAPTRA